ncbi:MAG: 1-acyl-sn-glycerol-3-phosphate acyltransferase [Zoogloeaceae bacterium]|jgi:1-acyl-sn-glycerol-3-phosphate acyltransferase|nr:1-acyl-sn-glycerol-3-phosphate acyltransferase [Zoogloeaceae bacterium]
MIFMRSLMFWICVILITIPVGILLSLFIPLHQSVRFFTVRLWWRAFMWLARHIVGVKVLVKGRENIPDKPVLVLSKHESAWETVGLQSIFVPAVFVLKKELLRIPFFGWGLFALRMIAINRDAGRKALQQMLEQGRNRLDSGIWVIVFPEGTRVPPGEHVPYKSGAAYLALKTGTPVLPVAHNAVDVWPKKAFRIHAGLITVSIGPLIATHGLKDKEINTAVAGWIEAEMRRIAPHRYASATDEAGRENRGDDDAETH